MAREANSPVNLVTKYVLFLLNFFIFILSGAVVGLMSWILIEKEKEVKSAIDFFLDPSVVLCFAGCIAFVVSFFGWWGAFRENVGCLKVYTWSMTILFFLQILLVILIFVIVYVPEARQTFGIYPEDALKEAIKTYRDDADKQDLIDSIQLLLGCCGTSNDDEGYKDWSANIYFECSENKTKKFEFCSVPFSCCKQTDNGLINYECGKNMQDSDTDPTIRSNTIYTVGCLKAMTSLLNDNVIVVGGILIGIFIPQMLLSWMSKTLTGQILEQMSKWNRPPPRPQSSQQMYGRESYPPY